MKKLTFNDWKAGNCEYGGYLDLRYEPEDRIKVLLFSKKILFNEVQKITNRIYTKTRKHLYRKPIAYKISYLENDLHIINQMYHSKLASKEDLVNGNLQRIFNSDGSVWNHIDIDIVKSHRMFLHDYRLGGVNYYLRSRKINSIDKKELKCKANCIANYEYGKIIETDIKILRKRLKL